MYSQTEHTELPFFVSEGNGLYDGSTQIILGRNHIARAIAEDQISEQLEHDNYTSKGG
jgi:hypothetical protein